MTFRSIGVSAITATADATVIAGVLSATISQDDSFTASRFSLQIAIPLGELPDWCEGRPLISVSCDLDGAGGSLITGYVDHVDYDPIQRLLVLTGRDLAALPIANLTPISYENRSLFEVVVELGRSYGLTANIASSQILFGRLFQANTTGSIYSQFSRYQSDWDVLCAIARKVQASIWVDGWNLNVIQNTDTQIAAALSIEDCLSVNLSRQADISQGIAVTVQSWNCTSETSILGRAAMRSPGQTGRSSHVIMSNITEADANNAATFIAQQLDEHAVTISIEMPGSFVLSPRAMFLFTGTGSSFDGMYRVQSVERRIAPHDGFTQFVQGYQISWTS